MPNHSLSSSLSPIEQAQVWREAVLAAGAPDNLSLIVLRYETRDGVQEAAGAGLADEVI